MKIAIVTGASSGMGREFVRQLGYFYKNLDEILNSDRTGKNSRGLGLGMSIVQKIMQEMGGKLSYQQTPTTFSLFLRNK